MIFLLTFRRGLQKKLANAPFSFSLTAHHLHQFSISDLVVAGTVYIGDKLEFNAGYNFSKRESLKVGNADGLAGFSFAAGLILEKLQVRYAKSWYQNTTGGNQLGINMTLNKYFGLGKFGQRIGW